MKQPKYPSLYQINTRVWLTELSGKLQRQATLDDIPDTELDRLAEMGFDWIWLLSVWTTGPVAQKISRENPEWRRDFEATLPDLKEEDIAGSGFAIAAYKVHPDLGGDSALQRLRDRLGKRGLKLMLDFVPNHMGPDHPWVMEHPEYFVQGTINDLESYHRKYTLVKRKHGDIILSYGRDPFFDGWPDTVQLDYSNAATVEAMSNELFRISRQCDGVRCDMAMLVLPEVFERTWGRKAQSFWPEAIKAIRERLPDFCFMAEVYWDMEWNLQQQGFDYAYDKRLYDRLCEGYPKAVREHFYAGTDYQEKLTRFLENHDEPRIASVFDFEQHKAAALATYLSPGFRFFHDGQFEGRLKRISPHLIRAPKEPINSALKKFYSYLIGLLKKSVFRDGTWLLLTCLPAWEENDSWNSFLAFLWAKPDGEKWLVCINYAPHASQCYVQLPFSYLEGKSVRFKDTLSNADHLRDGNEILSKGLYLDDAEWGCQVFEIITSKKLLQTST